ncbi:MAG: Asp-tRNA(Asn)/Glu-tRNA(Gln) amidotransferase GatCAB subunit C [Spirochaetaceae bacterium]|nr:MAG: Asp-tRNA(Asn)/Glu-tRNA(Gln) amidotransferase GatCAB subunit C [Spirochaetaceae bacterium]
MIEDKELLQTAELAQVELTDADREKLRDAVTRMIDYFSTMADVDVAGLEPMTHVHVGGNRTRNDEVVMCDDTDGLLENAGDLEDRYIAVPNVL